MSARDRIKWIKELIEKEGKITVSEISEMCRVTEETVRKDFNKLENEGVLIRVHGGAVLNRQPELGGVHFLQRQKVHAEEKKSIARLAARLIAGKATIFADASSTVVETVLNLPQNTELTVVTNSTELFLGMAQSDIHVISTGGDFNKKSLSLQGKVAKKVIAQYNVELALLSCKALDMKKGVQDSNESEAEIKEMMIEHAKEVALLVDHSKFDQTAFVHLLSGTRVDYLVTDRRPAEAWIDYCQKHDITLIYN